MKKIALCLLSLLFVTSTQAKENFSCNYKDSFHLSDSSHPEISVVRGTYDPELYLGILTSRRFHIMDASCQAGYAHVKIAYEMVHARD